jgi:hypothetical protein
MIPNDTPAHRQRLRQRTLRIGALLLTLSAALALLYTWYMSTPLAQAHALNQARQRWDTRPFERYHISVAQDTNTLLPMNMSGDYIVHSEDLDVRRNGVHQRSISSFFAWISKYPRTIDFRCGGLNFECTRAISYRMDVVYDAELGYPRQIHFSQTRHPDWSNPDFWRWLLQSGEWRRCTNLLCSTTRSTTVEIEALTPHP